MLKKKEFLIIFILAVWLTILSGVVPAAKPCPPIGITCPHSKGFPLVWYRVSDYLGREVYLNWTIFPVDIVFWFLVLAAGWWVIKWIGRKTHSLKLNEEDA